MILDSYVPLHKWFAWYPVRLCGEFGKKAWLQYVWRMHDSQQWLYYLNKNDRNLGGHAAA